MTAELERVAREADHRSDRYTLETLDMLTEALLAHPLISAQPLVLEDPGVPQEEPGAPYEPEIDSRKETGFGSLASRER